jgi:hypothetical protein
VSAEPGTGSGPARRRVLDYLPEVYRTDGGVLEAFLAPVQEMFDELSDVVVGTGGAGGLPDLFAPAATPPTELAHRGGEPYDFLVHLAGWLAIPLRPEKPVGWNRTYLARAIELADRRGTLPAVTGLLRAWLDGDLQDGPDGRPTLVLTDLAGPVNGVDTAFQLGVHGLLGVETVLGEGPAHFFVADLVVDPQVPDLRNPVGLDALQRSARALLDAEKPADSYYELRVRGRTMQLAPADPADARPGETYAQLEGPAIGPPADRPAVVGTTLLWDEPWVFGGTPAPFGS